MSIITPTPTLRPLKYSELWWQQWRENYAYAQYEHNQAKSRQNKWVLRRLQFSAGIGMVCYFTAEIFVLLREKFQGVA